MTQDDRPRRNQWVPGWVDRVWAWIDNARDGITWLVGFCLVVSVAGFGFFPADLRDRNQARALQADGGWVTAQDVRVHVDYFSGRGGGYFEVDRVRVRLADEGSDVGLENVNAWADIEIWDDIEEGWQNPTPVTHYEPPLEVRVRRDTDGTIVAAMAKDDYEYWTEDNSDPEFGLTLGFAGLGAAGALLFLNSIRLKRHSVRRQARIEATGKRGRE